MTSRRAWLPAAAVLATCYIATLAPSVTFWDAGEFIAAGHSLGIPHPPGTPLFILVLHAWGMLWPESAYAFGANLISALASAAAGGVLTSLLFRWLSMEWRGYATHAAVAGAICAGAMFTLWSNATEAEVYAVALLLAACMLAAGDAVSRRKRGAMILLAYLFGLAAGLHVSALVAAPAAIMLAAVDHDRGFNRVGSVWLALTATLAMAIGTWSRLLFAISLLLLAIALLIGPGSVQSRFRNLSPSLFAVLLGASPILYMLVRARWDPAINQGNPSDWRTLIDVVARHQYDAVPPWPRRAPIWIQIGNWFEYADWQSALSLGPSVVPTVRRTLVSLVFAALAILGFRAHRRLHRRSWLAMLVLFVSGTIGVTVYLNLRASPSFGWGILPDDVPREARERDYFFVLGFWAIGAWAGIGAIALAAQRKWPAWIGVIVAAAPIALNWSAANRRSQPEANYPLRVARGILEPLPPHAVLFTGGDNDSYPLWEAREVHRLRPDVTIVTVPLLGAQWNVDELLRRNPDLHRASTNGGVSLASITAAARAANRPVAVSLVVERVDRLAIGGCWRVAGLVLLDDGGGVDCATRSDADQLPVDTVAVKAWLERFREPAGVPKGSIDPVNEYFARLLDCPRRMLDSARKSGRNVSLDMTCNP
jgi:hypothetical protein